ncbi:MAG: hypothetical protein HZC04_00595 [Candidatus Lloydbacteria bacterium]|nr:hypothetical protein [Candidatus Lloydbacteria bacterium]
MNTVNNGQNNWSFGFGVSVLVASGFLAILGEILTHRYFLDLVYVSLPAHAWVEILGAVLGGGIAVLVWSTWKRSEKERPAECFLLASAFGSMGVLDIIHALVLPGNLFVWLHMFAMLVGAIFFAAAFFPKNIFKIKSAVSPVMVTAAAAALGSMFLLNPSLAPVVFLENQMMPLALNISLVTGVLFLATGVYFMGGQIEECRAEEMLIANFCMLSAASAMLFYVSEVWHAEWWVWHAIRFFGYVITLLGLLVMGKKNSDAEPNKNTI